MSWPRRQAKHVPPVIFGWTITGSPTEKPSTSGPTSSIHPAFSCPMIKGKREFPSGSMWGIQIPSTIWRSVRQTPAPPIRTTTSVDFSIFGSSTSSRLTQFPDDKSGSYLCNTCAFIINPHHSMTVKKHNKW